jgi:hypothetical protein
MPRVRGGSYHGGGGERQHHETEEVRAAAGPRVLPQLRAGMEGRSGHGMKTHEEDEVVGRSCAPPIARPVVR